MNDDLSQQYAVSALDPQSQALEALGERLDNVCRALEALGDVPTAAGGERLLTIQEAAEVLAMATDTFRRIMPRLQAAGLKVVVIPAARERVRRPRKKETATPMRRIVASSMARLIAKAIRNDRPLY